MSKPASWAKYVVGPVLLLPTIVLWSLWIKAFGDGATPAERIQIYLSHFPGGTTVRILTLIPLTSSVAAVIVASLFLAKATSAQRAVNIIVVVLGALFTLLNIFQLL